MRLITPKSTNHPTNNPLMWGLMVKFRLPTMAIFIFQFRYRGIGGYGATSPATEPNESRWSRTCYNNFLFNKL